MCGYKTPEKKTPEKPTFDWERIKDILNPNKPLESNDETKLSFGLTLSDSNSGKFTIEYKTSINIDQFILILEECFGIEADYYDTEMLDDDIRTFLEEMDSEEDDEE